MRAGEAGMFLEGLGGLALAQEFFEGLGRKRAGQQEPLELVAVVALQKRAVEEGIPYQTLIASLLHKYVSGRLVEKAA